VTETHAPVALVAGAGQYAAADVFYPADGGAIAAVVIAADPTFGTVIAEHVVGLAEVAEYRPGRFVARIRFRASRVRAGRRWR
jgi:deoxyribonuclease V